MTVRVAIRDPRAKAAMEAAIAEAIAASIASLAPSSPASSFASPSVIVLRRAEAKALAAAIAAGASLSASLAEPLGRTNARLPLGGGRRKARPFADAIVVVPSSPSRARDLPILVAALRDANVAAVQIAWRDPGPIPGPASRHVFATLEHARATPKKAPVVLARSVTPAPNLLHLVAHARTSTRIAPPPSAERSTPKDPR